MPNITDRLSKYGSAKPTRPMPNKTSGQRTALTKAMTS